mmetsp:Transcript_14089/g.31425  ORF Transcript_14089/g.31425 Transcript_14089/m.31425 type:complete len:85 (+) Transcript_14089:2703-2957(+)
MSARGVRDVEASGGARVAEGRSGTGDGAFGDGRGRDAITGGNSPYDWRHLGEAVGDGGEGDRRKEQQRKGNGGEPHHGSGWRME